MMESEGLSFEPIFISLFDNLFAFKEYQNKASDLERGFEQLCEFRALDVVDVDDDSVEVRVAASDMTTRCGQNLCNVDNDSYHFRLSKVSLAFGIM